MKPNSSKSPAERFIDWLRGLFASGERAGGEAANRGRGVVTQGRENIDDIRGRDDRAAATTTSQTQTQQSAAPPAPTPAAASVEESEDDLDRELAGDRSDFDDAAGDYDGTASYDTVSSDPDEANRLHDAVGGRDDEADDTTDGIIDTTRESRSRRDSAASVPDVDRDIPGVSEQDELTAFEGASTDEFAAGGIASPKVDREDVESAGKREPTTSAVGDSPSNVTDQHRMGGTGAAIDDTDAGASANAGYSEVREYNYGMGDLGVGGRRTDTVDAGTSAGQGDTDSDAETGTTEPSRSATGNDLDQEPDSIGTTLDYTAAEADAYDDEGSNLSAQEELTVSEGDAEESTRVTSFQSGTVAREGLYGAKVSAVEDTDETTDSYADFPDEPEPDIADDSGRDDVSGSDYPSDRRIDPLAGDDAWDAVTPDADEAGSSAGDLDTPLSGEEVLTAREGLTDAPSAEAAAIDRTIDQDVIATSDEHVGGEEPAFAESASRGTDETGVDDLAAPAAAVDAEVAATGGRIQSDDGGDLPAGAVRGDGTTNTPDGYPIKGNASSKIYHLPHFPSYKGTKAEFCFATEDDAIAAGFRAPGRRKRGKDQPDDQDEPTSRTGATATTASTATGVVDQQDADLSTSATTADRKDGAGTATGAKTGAVDTAAAELASEDDGTSAATIQTGEDTPAGAVAGDGTTSTPSRYPIKGNASSMLYHSPGQSSYNRTIPEWCFATAEDAEHAGYRAAGQRRAIDNADSSPGAAASSAEAEASAPTASSGDVASTSTTAEDADTSLLGTDELAATTPVADTASRDAADTNAQVTDGGTVAASETDAPAGAIRSDDTGMCPSDYPIKGNTNSKIFHMPHFPSYKGTKAEFCFATEDDAIAAGFRAPGRRNRGRSKP